MSPEANPFVTAQRQFDEAADLLQLSPAMRAFLRAPMREYAFNIPLKMDDGNNARAAEVVLAAVVDALLRLDDDERTFVQGISDAPLVNWNGITVGRLQAATGLRGALQGLRA